MSQPDMIALGKIVGVFGVKGWVKVFSHTEQRDGILAYKQWLLRVSGEWKPFKVIAGQGQGKGVVAQLDGIIGREQAQTLVGCEIAILREQLQPLRDGEYYWADLKGMDVVTTGGFVFGKVDSLFETGSNDVMVVRGEKERLVPWIKDDVIKSVSLEERRILVEWDPDF
jgi:16S rRNA processing protein RimM